MRQTVWWTGNQPRVTQASWGGRPWLGLPSSQTPASAVSWVYVQRRASKERCPTPPPCTWSSAEGLCVEGVLKLMQAAKAELAWLLEKILGEFLLINHSRVHFLFLFSVPTSFSSAAATTNSCKSEEKKSVLFLLLKKYFFLAYS